jgi:hypothetical protein
MIKRDKQLNGSVWMYKQKDIDFFLSFPTVRLELPSFEIQVTLTAKGALFYMTTII